MVSVFRHSFKYPSRDGLNWFPGHMMKGMNKMQHLLKFVDCLLEVHDARIPFTGRNETFKHRIGIKPRILLLSKADIVKHSNSQKNYIRDKLMSEQEYKEVLFCNSKQDKDPVLKKVVSTAVNVVNAEDRYNREYAPDYSLMVCGIPNVGKSSVINALRRIHMAKKKHRASNVGAKPGVTKAVMEKVKIVDYPPVFLYDTPGILAPTISNVDIGMKLAVLDYTKPVGLDLEIIADYLLFLLNNNEKLGYVSHYNLRGPTDNIADVLNKICEVKNLYIGRPDHVNKYRVVPNWNHAASSFLGDFRKGFFDASLVLDKIEVTNIEKKDNVGKKVTPGQSRELFTTDEKRDGLTEAAETAPSRLIGDISQLI